MSNDYLLKLHIEQPGTTYHETDKSNTGHVWYEIIAPDGTTFVQAGFGPLGDKTTLLPVQGTIYKTDGAEKCGVRSCNHAFAPWLSNLYAGQQRI